MRSLALLISLCALCAPTSRPAAAAPALESARMDGVPVRPDAPIVRYLAPGAPIDESASSLFDWTYTLHGGRKTVYLFAYSKSRGSAEKVFTPAEFGLSGEVCLVDPKGGSGEFQAATSARTVILPPEAPWSRILVPVSSCGIALVGAEGLVFADGRKRLPTVTDDGSKVRIRVLFARGERFITLYGFARKKPLATASEGDLGTTDFDATSGRFTVQVSASSGELGDDDRDDPVRHAVVELRPAP